MNIRWSAYSGVGLLLLAAMAGCSAFGGKKVANDASSGLYDKARLSYRVDTDRLNGSRREPADARLVSHETPTAARLPANSEATVEIRYPHPEKREGLAQVRVRIESQAGKSSLPWLSWWNSAKEELPGLKGAGWTQETWVLDVPQREVQAVVGKLRSEGYFYAFAPPHDATLIETELDGTKLSKKWTQVRELDLLIHRARTEGRLASSTKAPSTTMSAASEPASSVIAYREMLAEEHGSALASDTVVPPSSAPPPIGNLPPAAVPDAAGPVCPHQIVRLPPVAGPRRF